MNWEEIEKIIKTEGGKFIIVEDGKPRLVITSFDDYKNRLVSRASDIENQKEDKKGILHGDWEKSSIAESKDELTIDDLPL